MIVVILVKCIEDSMRVQKGCLSNRRCVLYWWWASILYRAVNFKAGQLLTVMLLKRSEQHQTQLFELLPATPLC